MRLTLNDSLQSVKLKQRRPQFLNMLNALSELADLMNWEWIEWVFVTSFVFECKCPAEPHFYVFSMLSEEVLHLARENDMYSPVFNLANKINFR
jgi:hypothetical protein